jgi:hypothetical protein
VFPVISFFISSLYRKSFTQQNVVFHFSPALKGEWKTLNVTKILSFWNNLAPFRVGERTNYLSKYFSFAVFHFFPLQKVFHSTARRFSFFPRPKGWMKNFDVTKILSFWNNLAPFRVGERTNYLSKYFSFAVFHFFPALKGEWKTLNVTKILSFWNNLAPFRVGERTNYLSKYFSFAAFHFSPAIKGEWKTLNVTKIFSF